VEGDDGMAAERTTICVHCPLLATGWLLLLLLLSEHSVEKLELRTCEREYRKREDKEG
jgi:hypothetical protein